MEMTSQDTVKLENMSSSPQSTSSNFHHDDNVLDNDDDDKQIPVIPSVDSISCSNPSTIMPFTSSTVINSHAPRRESETELESDHYPTCTLHDHDSKAINTPSNHYETVEDEQHIIYNQCDDRVPIDKISIDPDQDKITLLNEIVETTLSIQQEHDESGNITGNDMIDQQSIPISNKITIQPKIHNDTDTKSQSQETNQPSIESNNTADKTSSEQNTSGNHETESSSQVESQNQDTNQSSIQSTTIADITLSEQNTTSSNHETKSLSLVETQDQETNQTSIQTTTIADTTLSEQNTVERQTQDTNQPSIQTTITADKALIEKSITSNHETKPSSPVESIFSSIDCDDIQKDITHDPDTVMDDIHSLSGNETTPNSNNFDSNANDKNSLTDIQDHDNVQDQIDEKTDEQMIDFKRKTTMFLDTDVQSDVRDQNPMESNVDSILTTFSPPDESVDDQQSLINSVNIDNEISDTDVRNTTTLLDSIEEMDNPTISTDSCSTSVDDNCVQERKVFISSAVRSSNYSIMHSTQSSESINYLQQIDRFKKKLFIEAANVHNRDSIKSEFTNYWTGLQQLIRNEFDQEIPSDTTKSNEDYVVNIRNFLSTCKLRKLHNQFVLFLMKQCLRNQLSKEIFQQYIPTEWNSSVHDDRSAFNETSETSDVVMDDNLDKDDNLGKDNFEETFGHTSDTWTIFHPTKINPSGNEESLPDFGLHLPSETVDKKSTWSSSLSRNHTSLKVPGLSDIRSVLNTMNLSSETTFTDPAIKLVTIATRFHITSVLRNVLSSCNSLNDCNGKSTEKHENGDEMKVCQKQKKGKDDGVISRSSHSKGHQQKRIPITCLDLVEVIPISIDSECSIMSRLVWERNICDSSHKRNFTSHLSSCSKLGAAKSGVNNTTVQGKSKRSKR